jgi:hypothetical protein
VTVGGGELVLGGGRELGVTTVEVSLPVGAWVALLEKNENF